MDLIRRKPMEIPPNLDDGLETREQYNNRWYSIRVIYFTMFLMSLGFSIILTGIWPYLNSIDPDASKEFMGYVVAANPLGQMLFSPLLGWWSNRLGSIRIPLVISLTLFAIASALYSLLELRPDNARYWMLASRFFIGVSSSNIAVLRSYLSAATRLDERTRAVSLVSLCQVIGFIFGPAMQAAFTPLGSGNEIQLFWGTMIINMYTACGWLNVILCFGNMLLFIPLQECKIAAREMMVRTGKRTERETWKSIKPKYLSAFTLIVSFFVLVFNFVLLETLGSVLAMDQFAWSDKEALTYMGILMSVGGIVAMVTFISIEKLSKRFSERNVLIWFGFGFMVLGRLCHMPFGSETPKMAEAIYNVTIPLTGNNTIDLRPDDPKFLGCPESQEWCKNTPALTILQFIAGYLLTSIGYPVGVSLIQAIFTKVLGPRPQGVWMGLMTGAGCFSRFLGPVFVGVIYTYYGTQWTFGITLVMMIIPLLWLLLVKNSLDEPEYEVVDQPVEMQNLNAERLLVEPPELNDPSPDADVINEADRKEGEDLLECHKIETIKNTDEK